jgi:hypothetical protein
MILLLTGDGAIMRLIIAPIYLIGLMGPAICQTSAPPAQASISAQIRIDSFQSFRRPDNYGIASFVISNTTDKALSSIELTCWVGDDRAHGTKVLVWPSTQSIPAHEQQKFSNVNIGLVGPNPRAACEVTGAE